MMTKQLPRYPDLVVLQRFPYNTKCKALLLSKDRLVSIFSLPLRCCVPLVDQRKPISIRCYLCLLFPRPLFAEVKLDNSTHDMLLPPLYVAQDVVGTMYYQLMLYSASCWKRRKNLCLEKAWGRFVEEREETKAVNY